MKNLYSKNGRLFTLKFEEKIMIIFNLKNFYYFNLCNFMSNLYYFFIIIIVILIYNNK